MSKNLFDNDDGGSDEDISFNTNKDYAKSYNKFRQKELLKKLKDKEADDGSDSSSESDSSEDDEIAYNSKFDAEFFKTLSSLKRKDPAIYEKSTKFFDEDGVDVSDASAMVGGSQPQKKAKKLTIKQYEQDLLLKNSDILERSDSDDMDTHNAREQSPSYNEEQKMIKNEILGKIGGIDDSDDDDDESDGIGGLFSKREKTKKEQEEDDKEQSKWLDEHSEFREKSINEIWANKRLTKDEKFLRDYILSNGYADKDDEEIPTYDEIVGDSDEDFEEKQLEFEHKYNFRFEDPDQEFIKRYPRTIENSVRKVDSRRKEKRAERQERKELEKKEKFQEIEMLKELKRKEIEEKLSQLKAVTGADELNVDEIDLDGDFDPDEHDRKMQAIFNNEYYAVDEGDEKPEAPSDIEDLQVENYDEIDNDDENAGTMQAHCEDQDFNMDCDYDAAAENQKRSFQDEIIDSTRSNKRRNRKRKSKFMEMLETKRPAFNPDDEKTYAEYLDEYYKLDCEDIIGDVKCRFKYVETTPCDYGLSIEEILGAKNKELNAWASLKKATQIRPDHVERNDQLIFQKKAKNEALKRKILRSLYEPSDDEDDDGTTTEEMKKPTVIVDNKPLTRINCTDDTEKQQNSNAANQNQEAKSKKKKNKKKKNNVEESTITAVPQSANEKDMKNDIVKTSEKIQPSGQNQQMSQATKAETNGRKILKNKKAKQKNRLSKVAHKTIDKKNKTNKQKSKHLSDERLKAFGINPKKFIKQQKYAARNNQQNPTKKPTKPQMIRSKQEIKLKDKLKKFLKSPK